MGKILIVISFLLIGINIIKSQDSLGYYQGVASFYDFHGRGNCSYKPPSKPVYTAVVNTKQYNKAMLCGACLQVIGNIDTLIVRVEDRCPGCRYGGIDLSRAAFSKVEKLAKGRAIVRWKVVPCPMSDNIQIFVSNKHGSSTASFIVLNHKTPLKSVSVWKDSLWVNLDRGHHNYFTLAKKGGDYFNIQLRDWYGEEIIIDSVQLTHGTYIDLKKQFAN